MLPPTQIMRSLVAKFIVPDKPEDKAAAQAKRSLAWRVIFDHVGARPVIVGPIAPDLQTITTPFHHVDPLPVLTKNS